MTDLFHDDEWDVLDDILKILTKLDEEYDEIRKVYTYNPNESDNTVFDKLSNNLEICVKARSYKVGAVLLFFLKYFINENTIEDIGHYIAKYIQVDEKVKTTSNSIIDAIFDKMKHFVSMYDISKTNGFIWRRKNNQILPELKDPVTVDDFAKYLYLELTHDTNFILNMDIWDISRLGISTQAWEYDKCNYESSSSENED